MPEPICSEVFTYVGNSLRSRPVFQLGIRYSKPKTLSASELLTCLLIDMNNIRPCFHGPPSERLKSMEFVNYFLELHVNFSH